MTKLVVNELRDLTEQLSDFGSCCSTISSTDSDESVEENSENGGFKTMNEKKRIKTQKRMLKLTPGKEEFLKKPNLVEDN